MSNALSIAAAHWNKIHGLGRFNSKVRWWQCPTIIRHVNRRICGQPLDGITSGDIALLKARYPGRKFENAVSIGCGNGNKELELVKSGLVSHFDLFEISSVRIEQGRALASKAGLEDAMTFRQVAVDLTGQPSSPSYDLVYWNNALHHMLDVTQAGIWSKQQLKPGGVVYINDFIGPNWMEWTPEMLRIASTVRSGLPARMLRHPRIPWRKLPSKLPKVDVEQAIAIDPTECADSERILPAFSSLFPDGLVIPTGGLIYHTTLNDVIKNIDEVRDANLLDLLLLIDDMTISQGLSQYCVMVGDKD